MRLLFEIDTKDYDTAGKPFIRNSARCITVKNGRVAMIYSRKYDYYKFPGGGIEAGESAIDALIRETVEEAGLAVIPSSIREYGYVHRVQKSAYKDTAYFIQDNFYYLCETETGCVPQKLDDYEAEEGFQLCWVAPQTAIAVNRTHTHGPKDQNMLERESHVLELLLSEGMISR